MTAPPSTTVSGDATKDRAPLIRVRDLSVHFPLYSGVVFRKETALVRAVDGISLDIMPGETLGLVGESGCGKSTTGRALLNLYEPGIARISGEIRYGEHDLTQLDEEAMRPLRRELQIIFQDPYASLNPRLTVGQIIGEPLRVHGLATGQAVHQRVQELMDVVGLSPQMTRRYPHEFSGGQRQRIGIARALAVDPKFIVCDEPISALDVSIQAQVMNLMEDLQERFDLTYLFIAHDLAAVRHISDRVAVMYLGHIVELADAITIYSDPTHPYTQALLSAVPVPDPVAERTRERILLTGDVPSPMSPPTGCRFHTRCPMAGPRCSTEPPRLLPKDDGHLVACHLQDEQGVGS
ncbi:MAG: ATP-binding cassette domain-containing protein [Myxococcota bacterium]|nr:ATP-binding cassette domain-containing protein [Myxococcota bacterium]